MLTSTVLPLFFKDDGTTMTDIRRSWFRACKAAGLGRVLVHDLRRSAVKNFVDAGLDRSLAKQFTGHRSDAVFERYAIANDDSLKLAAAKMGAYLSQPAKKTGTEN